MSEIKHTPEPWFLGGDSSVCSKWLSDKEDEFSIIKGQLLQCYADKIISDDEADANAARIVACVNACARLTNEDLPHLDEVIQSSIQAMAENEELLKIIKQFKEGYEAYTDDDGHESNAPVVYAEVVAFLGKKEGVAI